MSDHPTATEVARVTRSAAYKARVAIDTAILPPAQRPLLPIPDDGAIDEYAARVALHMRRVRRGAGAAPSPWLRWSLARAYVQAEISRTPRTVERCASLAAAALVRLGVAIVSPCRKCGAHDCAHEERP